MKTLFGRFINKQREIRDLNKQLILIREENRKLKNTSSIEDKNNKMTIKIILRNRVGLILKSIGNFFIFRSKRIAMLNEEIVSLKKENIALQLKQQQAYDRMFRIFQQSASYHSQGSVDRAMR